MLNSVIRFALQQRVLVIAIALFVLGAGLREAMRLPIDVFPDLNRPRVTIMTEAHGMAPEEVETLITRPLEWALNGASDVQAVRSNSSVGLSVVMVEFNWGTDIYVDRQIVAEKLNLVKPQLPEGISPQLAPVSSIMGQIVIAGMWSEGNLRSPVEIRTLADWNIRPQLMAIPGVSQVFTMGGGRKQWQVLVNPTQLQSFDVALHDVEAALEESNVNVTGGHLVGQGPNELAVRGLGRLQRIEELKKLVVKTNKGRPVLLGQVAQVAELPQVKRGDSYAYARGKEGQFTGGPAVALTINKQPGADTRKVTAAVTRKLNEIQASMPSDIRINTQLYQQKEFIDRAIDNVVEALRDGGILVVIILFLFLLNFRTTIITLTAIPLSIVVTVLVFKAFGLSINTMTLGGLAVAMGELVDDAIVDVENIFRRLRENRHSQHPKPILSVVYQASKEVRSSIVFGTMIVVVVFLPLFALTGMEGRLFPPLAIAYIVSILSSLLVSLTVTPVLSYWLLRNAPVMERETDSWLLRVLKNGAQRAIGIGLAVPRLVLLAATIAVGIGMLAVSGMERDFLPPFNEGSFQANVVLPPGTSLKKSQEIARLVDERLKEIPQVVAFVSKTGRAELDEHAMGVNITEIVMSIDPESTLNREEMKEAISEKLADVPGIMTSVEQPLAHLISHMVSGVKARVGIKIYGDDLEVLRRSAGQIKAIISRVNGVTDPLVEQQVTIPQLRIEVDYDRLSQFGLTPRFVLETVETAMQGTVVSQILERQRTFDLLLRFDEAHREDLDRIERMTLMLPDGGTTSLGAVAKVYRAGGPNRLDHERVMRRIIVQCNTSGRGLVDVVQDIKTELEKFQLPTGYFIEYSGQFESEQSARQAITFWFGVAIIGVFLLLYVMFRSVNFALQVMVALPMAFIGAVAALAITGQTMSIAAMVGFISLCGIASRNGILLLSHYLHLVLYEGETWSKEMVVRAGKERLAPVLMTALTSGIGLVPLALAAGEPGKEILYPVATVIIGGLISSTLLEFLVRPALFWQFGLREGCRLVEQTESDDLLFDDETDRERSTVDRSLTGRKITGETWS